MNKKYIIGKQHHNFVAQNIPNPKTPKPLEIVGEFGKEIGLIIVTAKAANYFLASSYDRYPFKLHYLLMAVEC